MAAGKHGDEDDVGALHRVLQTVGDQVGGGEALSRQAPHGDTAQADHVGQIFVEILGKVKKRYRKTSPAQIRGDGTSGTSAAQYGNFFHSVF
ncbi:hypothetical protein CE91St43_04450 [Oscillospiraceae bacterium]|nr:hypothetical protein CE91St43_04450 [Oscillospiraceae bacterium]